MINLFNITYVHWVHSTVAICRTLRFHVLHRPQSDSIPCVVGFRNGTMTAEDWHQLHREAAQVAMLSTKAQREMPVLTWKSCEDFGNCPNINKFQFQKAVALHVTYLHHLRFKTICMKHMQNISEYIQDNQDRRDGYDFEMKGSYQWEFFSCAMLTCWLLIGLYGVCVAEARAQPQPWIVASALLKGREGPVHPCDWNLGRVPFVRTTWVNLREWGE